MHTTRCVMKVCNGHVHWCADAAEARETVLPISLMISRWPCLNRWCFNVNAAVGHVASPEISRAKSRVFLPNTAETLYTLNMLPDTHIAVLKARDIVGTYEEVWARLREREGNGNMPRTFLWVTGPSRTGDIEQTIQLGAHGLRRLHIVLVDDSKENAKKMALCQRRRKGPVGGLHA